MAERFFSHSQHPPNLGEKNRASRIVKLYSTSQATKRSKMTCSSLMLEPRSGCNIVKGLFLFAPHPQSQIPCTAVHIRSAHHHFNTKPARMSDRPFPTFISHMLCGFSRAMARSVPSLRHGTEAICMAPFRQHDLVFVPVVMLAIGKRCGSYSE